MKDLILDSGYGEWIGCPFSSNVHDQCIYIHWDCWEEKTNEDWYSGKFTNRYGFNFNFIDFIYYALLHEEMHLVLFELGEEDDRIDGKENVFHSKLISFIFIGSITGEINWYKQNKLDKWVWARARSVGGIVLESV